MNIVLFNLFTFPGYIKTCIKQIRVSNPTAHIHLITDQPVQAEPNISIHHINHFSITPYASHYARFHRDDTVKYHAELFFSSALRFLYIYELCQRLKLRDIVTFDNDVLLYGDLDQFSKLLDPNIRIAMTQSVPGEYICGFAYFRSYLDLTEIAGDFKAFIRYTTAQLHDIFKTEFPGSFLSEMSLLHFIETKRKLGIYTLPSKPDRTFPLLFDPITYGQVLGGTSSVPGVSFIDPMHKLAPDLQSNRLIIRFNQLQRLPEVVDTTTSTIHPLFNLHVHSKNLQAFAQ